LSSARVLVAYNQPVLPPEHPDYASEAEIEETSESISEYLEEEGFEICRLAYARSPLSLMEKIEKWQPDIVFNLFEGEADRSETEIANAYLLEWLKVTFTGSSSTTLALARDKIQTKYILQRANVPTAQFVVIEEGNIPKWPFAWPAIIKPSNQDASVGIEQASVVTSQKEFDARARVVLSRFGGPVIAEEFIFGRELHINLFEDPSIKGSLTERLQVVPPSEVQFHPPEDQPLWPIYSYEAKWNEHSIEFQSAPIDTALILPPEQLKRVQDVCRQAYALTGLRDYGRVDVRLTEEGVPYVIEVNPNPYLDSIILVEGLKLMEIEYGHFVGGIVHNALQRLPKKSSK
jgi:D-alanine-D-alanine ligase